MAKLILCELSASEKDTSTVSTPTKVGAWKTKQESLRTLDFNTVFQAKTFWSTQILTFSFFSTSSQFSSPRESRITSKILSIGLNCFIISA
jgi:hypothetical protein